MSAALIVLASRLADAAKDAGLQYRIELHEGGGPRDRIKITSNDFTEAPTFEDDVDPDEEADA